MPVGPEEFTARVAAAVAADGRLPMPDTSMAGWETFPFEPDSVRVRPLQGATFPEEPRFGEDPADCGACSAPRPSVWENERWRIGVQPSGVPLLLVAEPVAHHDLTDLPDDLAAELGVLVVKVARAVEALPHVARCHVLRIGDGGAHLHVFFFARPAGFTQLKGSFLAVWDDLLPPVPAVERGADARTVAETLVASFGGRVTG